MPRVGFESTIPASERAKTVHALDRWATVIDDLEVNTRKIKYMSLSRHRNEGQEKR
jgi:hypothetical protein